MPNENTRRLSAQFAVDRAQIENRRILGDDLIRPREVEHFAFFPSMNAAEVAAEEFASAGFSVTSHDAGDHITLLAVRSDAVDEEAARSFVREVAGIVEAHGGQYDGWGAPVVTARRPTVRIPDSPADIDWN